MASAMMYETWHNNDNNDDHDKEKSALVFLLRFTHSCT